LIKTHGLDFIAMWQFYYHATFSICEHTVSYVAILKKKKKKQKKKKKKGKRRNKIAEKRRKWRNVMR